MPRKLKPSTTPVGQRLIAARGNKTRDELGAELEWNASTLANYERGQSAPDIVFLQRLQERCGISLDWVLTGHGSMRLSDVSPYSGETPSTEPISSQRMGVDEEMMARVAEGIAAIYREENARIYPVPLVRAAARMYDDLVAAYDSPEERQVGLKGMLQQLRRELRSPGAAGANSKQVS